MYRHVYTPGSQVVELTWSRKVLWYHKTQAEEEDVLEYGSKICGWEVGEGSMDADKLSYIDITSNRTKK